MPIPLFDLIIASFFLFSMIIVSKFKIQIQKESKESYRNIFSGLALIAFMVLVNIYNQYGLFNSIPFISEPLFFKLLYWIGNITGITFLISGTSTWLPIARMFRRYNESRFRRLEFIKKVEQITRIDNRLTVILEQTLKGMVKSFNFTQGAVYVYAQKKNKMMSVSSISNSQENYRSLTNLRFKKNLTLENTVCNEIDNLSYFESDVEQCLLPDIVIPIKAKERLVGLFILYKEETVEITGDDILDMKIAADIIAQKITTHSLEFKNQFIKEQEAWVNEVMHSINFSKSTEDNLKYIISWLKEKISFDYFNLSFVHGDDIVQRITAAAQNPGLLNEIGVDFIHEPSVIHNVYRHGISVHIGDLAEETEIIVDNIILKSNMRSLSTLPVKYGDKILGVLSVASRQSHKFDNRQISYLEKITPILSSIINEEKHRYKMKRQIRRQSILNKLTETMQHSENIQDVFVKVVDIISKELKPTLSRISTYDAQGSFLTSRSMAVTTPIESVTPESGAMILSLMPYHKLVRETGRNLLINQEHTERKMPESEQKQFFGDGLKSALLVPIKVDEKTIGAISLGEKRTWSRYHFRDEDINFVSSISNLLSVALKMQMQKKEKRTEQLDIVYPNNQIPPSEQRSRIRSSLTGILGSVEILKAQKNPNEDNYEKCLAIIDKSARRINEFFLTDV